MVESNLAVDVFCVEDLPESQASGEAASILWRHDRRFNSAESAGFYGRAEMNKMARRRPARP